MKNPAVGMIQAAGRHHISIVVRLSEHAEYDRADKGECEIGGNNA